MKTTILLLSFASLVLPVHASEEHQEAKNKEIKELRKEIARQELIIQALKHRLHSIDENAPKLTITIHERHYNINGKLVAKPIRKDDESVKDFLNKLFTAIEKQCLAKNIRSVDLKVSSKEGYEAVQDAIDACKAAGVSNISIRHSDKKG